MIVSGTAGTGKSFLIHCLKALLLDHLRVMAPTGVAAFNVGGVTLHSLLHRPTRGEFKALEGEQLQQLQQLQQSFSGVDYLITDEMSMLGRKLFGQVDQRLRQAFPHRAGEVRRLQICRRPRIGRLLLLSRSLSPCLSSDRSLHTFALKIPIGSSENGPDECAGFAKIM